MAGKDPVQSWGLSKATKINVGSNLISLASPEYVILRKLEYYREGGSQKHIRDIVGILEKKSELKNSVELLRRIETLGLRTQWSEIVLATSQDP